VYQINTVDSDKRITTSITMQPNDITIREHIGTDFIHKKCIRKITKALLKSKWHQIVTVKKTNGIKQSEI
jgi:hypothetical protein